MLDYPISRRAAVIREGERHQRSIIWKPKDNLGWSDTFLILVSFEKAR